LGVFLCVFGGFGGFCGDLAGLTTPPPGGGQQQERSAYKRGDLLWVYNIETGGIRCSAEAGHSFENFESRYQKEIAEIK
ncbi:MAG: hypothetical protein VYD52_07745, partial [Pseudomonadota bacterium]|nr:hypothetical protein [Pseudomonadota bacterium]